MINRLLAPRPAETGAKTAGSRMLSRNVLRVEWDTLRSFTYCAFAFKIYAAIMPRTRAMKSRNPPDSRDKVYGVEYGEKSRAAALAQRRFEEMYETQPAVFRAPGRVNLIGEHTDYNDGFVMPAAIGICTYAAVLPSDNSQLTVHSTDLNETCELDLRALPRGNTGKWSDYVAGVAAVLQSSGHGLRGAHIVIASDIPIGTGLSSSAALEVVVAIALLSISNLQLGRVAIAKACQRAENEYTGTRCGIMDQFASCLGEAGCALYLDCRSLEYSLVPIPGNVRIVICDTGVKHELAAGEYNRRREECETGVEYLKRFIPGISALRDVSMEQLLRHSSGLSDTCFRRCRHVISENQRVRQAAEALKQSGLHGFGELMYESHASLRDDYEVSCPELDRLVEIARGIDGVFGARMTGGGFGGSTVNLVAEEAVTEFRSQVAQKYEEATLKPPGILVCSPVAGASEIPAGGRA